jgi:sensor histidine kinase YesM
MITTKYKDGSPPKSRVSSYVGATLLAFGFLFVVLHSFLDSVGYHNEEPTSVIVAGYIIAGVYAGLYLSRIWIPKNGRPPGSLIRTLLVIIGICLLIVFFAAQFASSTLNIFMGFVCFLLPFLVMSISTGILMRSIKASIRSQVNDARASAAQSRSELQFLQSQLSPHFLFNTLNNIYGISLSEHEKVPDLLLKLSSLLRYSVYDARELFVPLKDELNYIRDYIQFEQLRIGPKLQMTVSLEEPKDSSISIAPLLLIVFIENAFKHSKTTGNQPVFIDINLQFWNNRILFGIKNTFTASRDKQSITNRESGFGLDNVKKRLELLYPNEYFMEISETEGYYQVVLQLKMK